MPDSEKGSKGKLTLSVDKEVIDKAKQLGLNLSEITESVLRGFAFAPTQADVKSLYGKYQELFDTMLPLMKEYQTSIVVGARWEYDESGNPEYGPFDISLTTDGDFWVEEREIVLKSISEIGSYEFLQPKAILKNLINGLADKAKERQDKIVDLELVRRMVAVIADSFTMQHAPSGRKAKEDTQSTKSEAKQK